MQQFLYQYDLNPTTWVYLSSLLIIAIYFKFSRFWSIRNLDLLGLLAIAPGLLLLAYRGDTQQAAAIVEPSPTQNPGSEPAKSEAQISAENTQDDADAGNTSGGDAGSTADPEPGTENRSPDKLGGSTRAIGSDETNAAADAQGVVADENPPPMQRWGFVILFGVGFLFLVRLLADTMMVRRPLLEPNLSAGGLAFLGIALFVFLMTNVLTVRTPGEANRPTLAVRPSSRSLQATGFPSDRRSDSQLQIPAEAEFISHPSFLAGSPQNDSGPPVNRGKTEEKQGDESGNGSASVADANGTTPENNGNNISIPPATLPRTQHVDAIVNHPVLGRLPSIPSRAFASSAVPETSGSTTVSRILIVIAHLCIVLGLLVVGVRHFGNAGTGVAMATLYLLLPYTAQLVGRVDHVLPPAFLILAVVCYRRPALAGFLLTASLAVMLCPLPLFLFPLWISFYWQRGLGRFLAGVLCGAIALCGLLLMLDGFDGLLPGLLSLLGKEAFAIDSAGGFWAGSQWYWRIPVGALFLVISLAMAIWPAQKNLGTLISCSAALMLGAQFWYPFNGMMYVHWYLPLALLTVFRPNLENRVAIASLGQGWWMRKREVAPQAA